MALKQTDPPLTPLNDLVKKANEQAQNQSGDKQALPVTIPDIDLASLEAMTKEALISLIQRVGGAIWGYALVSDDERAEAARLKLYAMGMDATEVHKVVPALDKWFDRTQGKAAQSVTMKVDNTITISIDDRRRAADAKAEEMLNLIARRTIEHN